MPLGGFQQLIRDLDQWNNQIFQSYSGTAPRPWMRPSNWNGNIADDAGLLRSYDNGPALDLFRYGRISESMAAYLQFFYTLSFLRAAAMRYLMTHVRSIAHTAGRRRGHGMPNSVFDIHLIYARNIEGSR